MTTAVLEQQLDLEQLISELAPCDWAEGHRSTRVPCSEVAVGLVWQDCLPDKRFRACEHAVAWVRWAITTPHLCSGCMRPVAECWHHVPI